MKTTLAMADSFVVEKHGLRIFRIQHSDSATLLWLVRDHALNYLKQMQTKKLQAKQGR